MNSLSDEHEFQLLWELELYRTAVGAMAASLVEHSIEGSETYLPPGTSARKNRLALNSLYRFNKNLNKLGYESFSEADLAVDALMMVISAEK